MPKHLKPAKSKGQTLAEQFLAEERHSLREQHLPRITRCLRTLSQNEIWWRPHPTSNSIGNPVLHLAGNVRQWIISGLGGHPNRRERDKEFAALGPIPQRSLVTLLESTVNEATGVLEHVSADDLAAEYNIQGFRVTGLIAVAHVAEHFAYHTGQIIYATKFIRGVDLKFTHLPGENRKTPKARKLSQV